MSIKVVTFFFFSSCYQHFPIPLFYYHQCYHAFVSFLFYHFLSPFLFFHHQGYHGIFSFLFFRDFLKIPFHEHQGCHAFFFYLAINIFQFSYFIIIKVITHLFVFLILSLSFICSLLSSMSSRNFLFLFFS